MAKNKEPLFHLVKRVDINKKHAWLIRGGAFLFSMALCAIVSVILTKKGLGNFFERFFVGGFASPRKIWNLLHDTALLLIIALALTPCFKMKFWNIGGEGQVLMGALGSAVIINFCGGEIADGGTIVLSLMLSMAFGMAWAAIPAVFKAVWNTNETLLTLMMNYIAVCLTNYFIKSVATKGTGILNFQEGIIGPIFGNSQILKIIVVALITLFMYVYLKKSKHGYELTVVGESERTAKYIGINTKKVIIRTLVLCGAICGIAGFLLVSATDHSINAASTVGGRGFVAVLLSWLAHFNPLAMVLTSLLYVFIDRGSTAVATGARLGGAYPEIMTGIFFFCIIASEFFINYKIILRDGDKIKAFFEQKVFKKWARATDSAAEEALATQEETTDNKEEI